MTSGVTEVLYTTLNTWHDDWTRRVVLEQLLALPQCPRCHRPMCFVFPFLAEDPRGRPRAVYVSQCRLAGGCGLHVRVEIEV